MEYAIKISPDGEGYIGRECPQCEKYFKIKFGTGLPGEVPCHCPYCNYTGPQSEFLTKQQIKYAQSIALHKMSSQLLSQLKRMERKPDPHAMLSIGITVKGSPTSIAYYSEETLEHGATCSVCTLEYAIYGAFGYCPDCGTHNSLQILRDNFRIVTRMLTLADTSSSDIAKKLTENALEDAVASFDGFGRELCRKHDPKISFQNLSGANDRIFRLFGRGFPSCIGQGEWSFIQVQFQNRHLLAHTMGVIDEDYIRKTGGKGGDLGRAIMITKDEVVKTIAVLEQMADFLFSIVPKT